VSKEKTLEGSLRRMRAGPNGQQHPAARSRTYKKKKTGMRGGSLEEERQVLEAGFAVAWLREGGKGASVLWVNVWEPSGPRGWNQMGSFPNFQVVSFCPFKTGGDHAGLV